MARKNPIFSNPPGRNSTQALNHRSWGLLWLDWDNKGVENTLPQAIARFKVKFKRPPTVIYLLAKTVAHTPLAKREWCR